jgi:hypothetical protein
VVDSLFTGRETVVDCLLIGPVTVVDSQFLISLSFTHLSARACCIMLSLSLISYCPGLLLCPAVMLVGCRSDVTGGHRVAASSALSTHCTLSLLLAAELLGWVIPSDFVGVRSALRLDTRPPQVSCSHAATGP